MINHIIKLLENSNLFLTGGGGVGKSYATQKIIEYYRAKHKNVIVLGSTGMSAVNIGGVTLHSFFSLGICKNLDELREYDRGKKRKDKIKELNEILENSDLLVIDEISMVSAELFDLMHYRLMNSKFSARILVVGDFYQLPPVIKKSDDKNSDLFRSNYAFSAYSWDSMKFTFVQFLNSKRTKDLEFYEKLSHIRVGKIDDKTVDYIEKFITTHNAENSDSTVLFGRNKEADELNKLMLEKINSPLEISYGKYEIFDNSLHIDRVKKWLKNLNVADVFMFKIGAKVIFTTNKYSNFYNQTSFYNGEQGVIVNLSKKDGEIVSITVKKSSGETIDVEPNSYDLAEIVSVQNEIKYEVLASYYQFPLRLAYAITIHKSQGMSIENLVCDLNHIFTDGQLYVALSRAINPQKLKIIYNKKESFKSYINRVVKVSDEVKTFCDEQSFICFE